MMSPMAAGTIRTPSEPFSQMKLEVCCLLLACLSYLYFPSLLSYLSLPPARRILPGCPSDEDLPRHQELLLCGGKVPGRQQLPGISEGLSLCLLFLQCQYGEHQQENSK